MKTTTAFLVAVTVFTSLFLESSTAPNPMLGGLTSNIVNLVTNVSQGVGGVVGDAGKTVGGLVLGTGKVVDGVVSDTGKVVGGVVREVDTLVTGVLEAVTQAISKIVKDVTGSLGGLRGTVETTGGELGEKLKNALAAAETTLKQLNEFAQNIVKAVAEDATDTVKELDVFFKKTVEKLNARLAAVTDIVKQISEKAGDDTSVVNKVKAVVAKVTEGVKNIVSNVDKVVKSKTTKVVDGSDQLRLPERITSSNKALEDVLKALKEALDDATGDYKDGLTEVYKWLTEDFKPLVAKTHLKLEQVVQGTSEERKAMANELRKIIEIIEAKLYNFTNIPETVKIVLDEKIEIVILGNARIVADQFNEA